MAWSENEFLLVAQYVGKRTSRTLVFSRDHAALAILLDKSQLIGQLPVELREHLRANDHVFVEASQVEGGMLFFRVWGYGLHDPNGFRWRCQYAMSQATTSCSAQPVKP